MKKIASIIIVLFMVIACKEESNPLNKIKEAADSVKEVKQGFENINEVVKGYEDVEENIKKLTEITPITKEEIKDWMPKEVGDLKRTEFNIANQMGISTFKLTFKGEGKKRINITISDGAGNGSAIVSMYMMFQNIDVDKENEFGYERTQIFDGQRTLIKYRASQNQEKATLQCLLNQRFGIEANAWEMTPEELWSFIKKMNINTLQK